VSTAWFRHSQTHSANQTKNIIITTPVQSSPSRVKSASAFRLPDGRNLFITFVLVTTLFLLWGFCNGITEWEQLLGELGRLAPDDVHFRTHNLLNTDNGTPAL
jgi:hypothetical protein